MTSHCWLTYSFMMSWYPVPQILTTHAMEEADHLCTRIGMFPNTSKLSPIHPMPYTCIRYHAYTHSLMPIHTNSHPYTRYNELWPPALPGHTDTPEDSVRHWLPAAVPLRPREGPGGGELHRSSATQGHPHRDLCRWARVCTPSI